VIGAVAHYNLLERIGNGGLGEVYRARDTKVGRTVALKLAPPGFPEGKRRDRLVEDARAAATLSHPNIATLWEVGEHEGRLYFAYEFIQGSTVRQLMANGPMNMRHALDMAVQLADALAEAHSHGVLHKDLRPEIILETGKGSAKILDFGMSLWSKSGQTRSLAAAVPDSVGSDGAMIVAYMSPEQALGGGVDERTDVFSLALIIYEMLTGQYPFAAEDAATILINIARKTPPPPTSFVPELPKMIDVVLSRALTKTLDRRSESASRLLADLRRCRSILDRSDSGEESTALLPTDRRGDLLPIEEERGGTGLWWLLLALGAGMGAAVYFWLR
jgi:eukaryotic-like serine/threonine-protein kinase